MENYQNCGLPSWLITFLTILSLNSALLAVLLTLAKVRTIPVLVAVLSLVVAGCSVAAGPFGTQYGKKFADDATSGASISPEQRDQIRKIGYQEAEGCITVGLVMGVPSVLVSVGVLVFALLRRPKLETT